MQPNNQHGTRRDTILNGVLLAAAVAFIGIGAFVPSAPASAAEPVATVHIQK